MAEPLPLEGRSQRVTCGRNSSDLYLLQADIHEGMGMVTEMEIEFLTQKTDLKPDVFLADVFTIEADVDDSKKRKWVATCVESTYVGMSEGMGHGEYQHFKVLCRSWPWLLSRTQDCKIYQDMTADDIVKQVFSDAGFSDVQWKTSKTPPQRVYTVQYRETHWNFVQRLLAEEGRFFFTDYSDGKDKLFICDDSATLNKIPGESKIELIDKESGQRDDIDYIDNWMPVHRVETDKVTLNDYDFEKSKTKLTGTRQGSTAKYEDFDYPGLFLENADGTNLARRKLESLTALTHRVRAEGIIKELHVGGKFELIEHPTKEENQEYLVLRVHHRLRLEKVDEDKKEQSGVIVEAQKGRGHRGFTGRKIMLQDPEKLMEKHSVEFDAQPSKIPYVPPPKPVPIPTINGIQTAEVVGPSGEEIYTDEFGRVKVQFHWDRYGKKDEKTTCFIRVATPIAGKSWGMVHLPRIGQEVVVQFLEGNPDRPLIVGSVYNDVQKTPFTFPDDKTKIGLISDTHKNEDTNAKHELWFEEKKDSEVMRMQSEKDWDVNIKNSATINIGTEEKPDGDMDMKVWRHTTRSFGEGSGEGNVTETIQNNFTKKLLDGDYTLDVDTGSRKTTIKTDDKLTIEGKADEKVTGTKTVKADGAITIESTASITLKVGGTSMKIDSSGATISAPQVKVSAQSMLSMSGVNSELKGSAMLTLQGGIVKIN